MKIKWLVEKNMFPEYEEHLVTAIKAAGAECYLFDDSDRDFKIKNYQGIIVNKEHELFDKEQIK